MICISGDASIELSPLNFWFTSKQRTLPTPLRHISWDLAKMPLTFWTN